MSFISKLWKNRVSQYPTRYTLREENGASRTVYLTPSNGTVSEEGDVFDEATMNSLETRISNAVSSVETSLTNNTNLLDGRISSEVNRASGAESTLQSNINTVSSNLSSEITRAQNAEASLRTYVDNLISTTYKASGSLLFVDLPALDATRLGHVYNVRDDFTTTSDFLEGAGKSYKAGTNVAIVGVDNEGVTEYYYDVMTGFVDFSDFVQVGGNISALVNDVGYIIGGDVPEAGVQGVKGNAESEYRKGNVNLTPANLGLGDVGNFKAVSTVANQSLTDTEKANARTNIGASKRTQFYGTCATAATEQVKIVTIPTDQNFALEVGARITVKFSVSNTYSATASAPCQLNVNSTGAKQIYFNNTATPTGTLTTAFGYANRIISYVYDGTYWVWDGMGTESDTRDFRIGRARSGASASVLYFIY